MSNFQWVCLTWDVKYANVQAAVFLNDGCFIVSPFLYVAPYVKVYLLNNGAYVAKRKTKSALKTLDPLYQQALLFEESPQGKVLQVSPDLFVIFHCQSLWISLESLNRRTCCCEMRGTWFSSRSLCGGTMAAWTIKASWGLHKSYWRNWIYQAQSLLGTSYSHHPQ